jgi:hypothetical protein
MFFASRLQIYVDGSASQRIVKYCKALYAHLLYQCDDVKDFVTIRHVTRNILKANDIIGISHCMNFGSDSFSSINQLRLPYTYSYIFRYNLSHIFNSVRSSP